jgi:hypothetical protein
VEEEGPPRRASWGSDPVGLMPTIGQETVTVHDSLADVSGEASLAITGEAAVTLPDITTDGTAVTTDPHPGVGSPAAKTLTTVLNLEGGQHGHTAAVDVEQNLTGCTVDTTTGLVSGSASGTLSGSTSSNNANISDHPAHRHDLMVVEVGGLTSGEGYNVLQNATTEYYPAPPATGQAHEQTGHNHTFSGAVSSHTHTINHGHTLHDPQHGHEATVTIEVSSTHAHTIYPNPHDHELAAHFHTSAEHDHLIPQDTYPGAVDLSLVSVRKVRRLRFFTGES